ncbi:fimbrial protein [Serratia fonticola]|uniref:Fimbrial protein n=1 Tax=Serratia fonticola TaxID=47917 RepID=A0ABY9PRE4_SERFO|nr:fimbrial protein [Serratia fonticola]WMT15813.1 fimbrial protein [Serratia fonticola]
MLNSKCVFLLAAWLLASTGHAALIASSQTRFMGRITVATCNIVVGDDNQTINMGEISNAELDTKGKSSAVPFIINLYGCDTENKTVKLAFDRVGTGASGSLIAVDGVNGIALGLLDSNGNPLYFGNKSVGQKINKGDNTLLFSAYIAKTGPINSGTFSRLLHYTLYYD